MILLTVLAKDSGTQCAGAQVLASSLFVDAMVETALKNPNKGVHGAQVGRGIATPRTVRSRAWCDSLLSMLGENLASSERHTPQLALLSPDRYQTIAKRIPAGSRGCRATLIGTC